MQNNSALAKQWWKEASVYLLYPRSFQDSNGDGIGDLRGIINRLDYLQKLGIDVIWFTPIYKSPNDDNGYDVSDYYDIMDEFGTMEDFDELMDGIHKRGMKIVMDMVMNHTSDEHKWFIESRSSKDNPYRDYYFWKPGKDGKEPNNWLSYFSGSAWEFDKKTEEYYLHLYSRKQPDVNWDNENLRKDMYKIMLWWLDKGIDGFRVDAINSISKKPGLPSVPDKDKYNLDVIYSEGPRLHEYLREMARETYLKYDVMSVGETPGATPEIAIQYSAPDSKEFNMIFHFDILKIDFGYKGRFDPKPWSYKEFKSVFPKWQKALYGKTWYANALGNMDFARLVSRFGNDKKYWKESAKLLATILLAHFGTPYLYQGDEIGMTNVDFKSMKEVNDIDSVNSFKLFMEEGGDEADFLSRVKTQARDHARTPLQWDSSKNGGFTTGTPWLMVNPNFTKINVENAEKDPDSILHYYRKLLKLRKENPIFVYGDYQNYLADHDTVYMFTRSYEGKKLLVIMNFGDKENTIEMPKNITTSDYRLLTSNYKSRNDGESLDTKVTLLPWEANIYIA